MPIRITSKNIGGYCCGANHPRGTRTYPDDWFTDDQIEELNAHPSLTAERIATPTAKKTPTKKATAKKAAAKKAAAKRAAG